MKPLTLNELARALLAGDDYLILTHRRPDGDTVGCAAALCRGLRQAGKTAFVYDNPQFTPKFRPYVAELLGAPQAPTVITVDVASRGLFPFGMEGAEVALALDHHGSNEGFAAAGFVDGTAAACGELVWTLLPLLGVTPDRAMAEAVYLAVSTDTGCFRYANVTPNTLRTAADCLAAGADTYAINRVMFETKRKARLALEAYLIETMEFYHDGAVAVSALPREVLDRLGITEDDVDDISGFGRTVEGVRLSVMLREVEDGLGKISVRSEPGIDASAVCKRLGGGGHPGAAGASVPGGIEGAKAAILAAIDEAWQGSWQEVS